MRGAPRAPAPRASSIPLDEQDRARWDRAQIAEGLALVAATLRARRGRRRTSSRPRSRRATTRRRAPRTTDWPQILALYERAARARRTTRWSTLNHAIADGDGPRSGRRPRAARAARGDGSPGTTASTRCARTCSSGPAIRAGAIAALSPRRRAHHQHRGAQLPRDEGRAASRVSACGSRSWSWRSRAAAPSRRAPIRRCRAWPSSTQR